MADEEEKKTSGGGLLPVINMVLLVLVLAVGSFVAWKLIQMEQSSSVETASSTETPETKLPEANVEDPDVPPVLVEVDKVTINLAGSDGRYLRASIKLEVRGEGAKDKLESNLGKVKVKDLINGFLSSKTYKEISTPIGKYRLKEDLVVGINKLFPGKPVKKLYFTDFVSQ